MATPEAEWIGVVVTGAIAAIGGFVTALGIAFKAAWNLSRQLTETKDELAQKIDDKVERLEHKLDTHDQRLRHVEQALARLEH
jgi:hypothetical protein